MILGKTISLVIPCRNEENSVGELLSAVPVEVDEVLICDNRSTDRTKDIALEHGARVIEEKRTDAAGIGYGYAIRSGIEAATGDIVVTMDADGTYPVAEIPALVNTLLERNLDFASCCRLPRLEPQEKLWIRIAGVVILNIGVRLLYGYRMRDSLSGMMVFRKERLSQHTFSEGGWNLSLELKLRPLTDGSIRFTELHIPYHDRIDTLSKQQIFRTGFTHLLYLFQFRVKKRLAGIPRARRAMASPHIAE